MDVLVDVGGSDAEFRTSSVMLLMMYVLALLNLRVRCFINW